MAEEKKDTKFKPGTPKPPNSGRKRGQANVITLEMKEFVKLLVEGEQDTFRQKLSELEGKDYCSIYLRMLEFVLPKQRELSGEVNIRKTTYTLPDGSSIEI